MGSARSSQDRADSTASHAKSWPSSQTADAFITQAFSHAAQWASRQCGRATTFCIALAMVCLWALTGPVFHFSDSWQLVINTGTTIITFLMVFLIQNTQNRDTASMQLKLDELIRASKNARNKLLSLEDMTDAELEQMKQAFARLGSQSGHGRAKTSPEDAPDVASAQAQEARPPRS